VGIIGEIALVLSVRPPRITWFQSVPSASCSGTGLGGAELGADRRAKNHSFDFVPVQLALQQLSSPLSTYCNHGSLLRGFLRSYSI
jgi:hypothetical protein